jgi:hypothetical protein
MDANLRAKHLNLAVLFLTPLVAFACGSRKDQDSSLAEDFMAKDGHFEADWDPAYKDLATGVLTKSEPGGTYDWPVNILSIGHTMASYQYYGGAPYFHHGLDIRADAGTDVIAAVGGKVVNIENYSPGNAAYWEIAILDPNGFLWQYHHIEHDSIPRAIHDAFRNETEIATGTKLGEVFFWGVDTFGERYHHIHLNVLGANREYLNPFAFLKPLADERSPQIVQIGALKNRRAVNGNTVTAPYSLYATIHDLILHERFVVPPNRVAIKVDGGEWQTVWKFDTLPGGSSNEEYVSDFFVPSLTCGNYDCRKLTIDLGFVADDLRAFPQTRGLHHLEVEAEDYAGNKTTGTYDWTVQ